MNNLHDYFVFIYMLNPLFLLALSFPHSLFFLFFLISSPRLLHFLVPFLIRFSLFSLFSLFYLFLFFALLIFYVFFPNQHHFLNLVCHFLGAPLPCSRTLWRPALHMPCPVKHVETYTSTAPTANRPWDKHLPSTLRTRFIYLRISLLMQPYHLFKFLWYCFKEHAVFHKTVGFAMFSAPLTWLHVPDYRNFWNTERLKSFGQYLSIKHLLKL